MLDVKFERFSANDFSQVTFTLSGTEGTEFDSSPLPRSGQMGGLQVDEQDEQRNG